MAMKRRWNTSSLPFVHRRGTRSKMPVDRLLMVVVLLNNSSNKAKLIDAWFERYEEMLGGEIPGTVDILRECAR